MKCETKVKITDVKPWQNKIFKSEVKSSTLCLVDDMIVSTKTDLSKALKKIRPDSPDVIRAAKRFEQARLRGNCELDRRLETVKEYDIESFQLKNQQSSSEDIER